MRQSDYKERCNSVADNYNLLSNAKGWGSRSRNYGSYALGGDNTKDNKQHLLLSARAVGRGKLSKLSLGKNNLC
jgi:hypothetical protein